MPTHFKIVGVIRLSLSQKSIKIYSDRSGYIGNALRDEILKLFRHELDHVSIVVYDEQPVLRLTEQQSLDFSLQVDKSPKILAGEN